MARQALISSSVSLALAALLATPSLAAAEDGPPSVAVSAKVGFLTGIGLDVAVPLADNINLRAGGSGWRYDRNFTESGIDYKGELRLRTAGVFADWYPTYGIFRVTAGLVRNTSRFTLNGKPSSGGSVQIGDNTYQASDLGTVEGQVNFKHNLSPFIGVGFGNPTRGGHWGFVAELGAIRQRTPKATLTATCSPTLEAAEPARCAQLQADAAAEEAELQDSMKDWRWYPALSVGLALRF
jgi:hypothetical protein